MQMQQLRTDIHTEPQEPRVPRGDTPTGHQDILFRGKWTRCRLVVRDGERERISLDKKNEEINVENSKVFELDELYWFIERKPRTETRENVYLMTMVNRFPRQIVGFDVAYDKSPQRIQAIVDGTVAAERYCSDGWLGYIDVVYPGEYIRNTRDKSDTFTVEGVNADLRHYIPILARRSRCFARTLETFRAVIQVFIDAYNRFGSAKYHYRQLHPKGGLPFALVDFF